MRPVSDTPSTGFDQAPRRSPGDASGAVVGALLLKAALFIALALAAVSALATWLAYVPGAARRER